MQNLKTALFLLLIVAFYSCNDGGIKPNLNADEVESKYKGWSLEVQVIEVDGCEYVIAQTGLKDGGISIIHKQNCKYCADRK